MLRLTCEFVAGCLIQRAYQLGQSGSFSWSIANFIALAVLATCLLHPPAVPLSVLPFGFLIMSLAHYNGWLNQFLSTRTVMFLGEISYSLYLMHFIIMQIEGWYAARLPATSGALKRSLFSGLVAVILVVSICTWKWVERTARDIGRKLADRLAPPSQPLRERQMRADQDSTSPAASNQTRCAGPHRGTPNTGCRRKSLASTLISGRHLAYAVLP
jgi:peptidoglycan/LPS O-acetylase OafA/YrhL